MFVLLDENSCCSCIDMYKDGLNDCELVEAVHFDGARLK